MSKKICVIGSGASGLVAIKSCLEEGFHVTCFEQSNFIGGLWKYRDDDVDGLASVARTTIINSSKEMSAYSDFPPPKDFANYMHNTAMHAYFELYAEHFGLKKHIQFHHRIVACQPNDDYDKTGRWKVTALDLTSNTEVSQIFDGVMVCTGHHVKPLVPTFKGQEKFKGKIIHTHSYKKPQPFEDQNVVVVGIGNSGGDAAVELSMFAKKVYLAVRRGAWILWRIGTKGQPMDSETVRRYLNDIGKVVSRDVLGSLFEREANKRFDHEVYRIKPNHGVFCAHPTVNDSLPNRILSGTVILKNNIREFTENGVIFEGDDKETPCDSVVLATGYEISFPFLDKSVIWSQTEGKIELFKYVFSPHLAHPHTLAVIGLIQPLGPLIPISEEQCRWFAQLMAGKCRLPSKSEMLEDILKKRQEMAARYTPSPRHQVQVDYPDIMDEITEQFGARPNLKRIFFTDPVLWYHLYFGPFLPYQFRLEGPHAWPKARETILSVEDRIKSPFDTRKLDKIHRKSFSPYSFSLLAAVVAVFFYLVRFFFLNQ